MINGGLFSICVMSCRSTVCCPKNIQHLHRNQWSALRGCGR